MFQVGNSQGKGTEGEMNLVSFRNSGEARAAGEEGVRWRDWDEKFRSRSHRAWRLW